MRCLALAEVLRSSGASVEFLSRELPGDLRGFIVQRGFPVHCIESDVHDWQEDLLSTTKLLAHRVNWIVVDHYGLDARWEQGARNIADAVAVIDDIANRTHDCDLLLDQNFHREPAKRYFGLVPDRCERLFGPKFALLRPEFRDASSRRRARTGRISRILVSFGASDPTNETLKALDAVDQLQKAGGIPPDLTIDVVIGSSQQQRQAIETRCKSVPRHQLHVAANNMAELINDADLVIGGGGISTWERCALGAPSLIIAVADNQKPSTEALADAGHVFYLGESSDVSANRIADALRGLLALPSFVASVGRSGPALVDGLGTLRVADRLMPPAITFRRAAPIDRESIFEWRNHEANRRYSGDPQEISWERHVRWFDSKIEDSNCDLLIALRDASPIGVLRYDISGRVARVSIYLIPNLHGRGLGRQVLGQGARWLRSERPGVKSVLAEVLDANGASRASFLRAGFTYESHLMRLDL